MGNKYSFENFTQDMIDEYVSLTYLSRYEILRLFKKFHDLDPENIDKNFYHRINAEKFIELFPMLNVNPFKRRILKVFCSHQDGYYSFEDMLDLCSAMSDNCPDNVKARWAFKIYDFDDDEVLNKEDIIDVIKSITVASGKSLTKEEQEKIADELLRSINIQNTGGITSLEFEHAVGKMSEFSQSFRFQI